MYNNLSNITIEKEVSYVGRTDTFTIGPADNSIPIIHEVGGFMHKKVKPETIKLSHTEYKPIKDVFENIDFQKVYNESGGLIGCDGWTLKVSLSNVMSGISVSIWCPSKSPETPETTNLLQACENVFSFFGEEL